MDRIPTNTNAAVAAATIASLTSSLVLVLMAFRTGDVVLSYFIGNMAGLTFGGFAWSLFSK